MKTRLDRYLSNQLNISRSDAKELIKKREVEVSGITAKLFDMKVSPENDTVSVSGKKIVYRKHVYIMLNKPSGVVCAVRDEISPTVISLIPEELMRKNLAPAGRLDKDTEGFVFITDDGDAAHRLISPACHVNKIYHAKLKYEADESYISKFRGGLEIDSGEKCKSAEIVINSEDKRKVIITIHEGKYHQIKRMIKALDNEVVYLKRVQIGNLPLDPLLPLGNCREITNEELVKIYEN